MPRPRIVAIDDDPSMLAMIQTALASYTVEGFTSPEAALRAIFASPPDLVITGHKVPGLAGLDVIAAIRRSPVTPQLPVVVLSIHGEEDVIVRCFSVGADEYLVRPISEGELKAKIGRALSRANAARTAAEKAAAEHAGPSGLSGIFAGDAAGRTFSGYRIVRKIGKGGMGAVYEAVAPAGQRVALKVLPVHVMHEAVHVKRFIREAENLKAVRHANVAGFHEFGRSDQTYFMAMEYVDGSPIDLHASDRSVRDEGEIVDLVRQIVSALDALHRLEIVHRDVKPTNILVTRDGVVKLVDFGLTRRAVDDKITQTDVIMGTPYYIAPEQILGAEPDIRSDLYSLGVVFYFLATGEAPFKGDTPFVILHQHTQQPPPEPRSHRPDLSERLNAIILKLLEKNPSSRYQSPAELLTALDEHRLALAR